MSPIPGLSPEKQTLLNRLVEQLRAVPGVAAIVLGGSYASGTFHAASDLDVGLYYHEDRPFPITERVAHWVTISTSRIFSPLIYLGCAFRISQNL